MTQDAQEINAEALEAGLTGNVLTPAEADLFGRQLSKGYGQPYEAYRVGIRDGIAATLEAVRGTSTPTPDASASETPSEAGETVSPG